MDVLHATIYTTLGILFLCIFSMYIGHAPAMNPRYVCTALEEASHSCKKCDQDRNATAMVIHATQGAANAKMARQMMNDYEIQRTCRLDAEHIYHDCKARQKMAIQLKRQRPPKLT